MLRVDVTRRTVAQIERATQWWSSNRPAAPDAITLAFEEAKELLAHQPGVGARSASARYPDLRRLYPLRVRYHIYYYTRADAVIILAFWHASREAGPRL